MFDKIINAITSSLSYYDFDVYSELIRQDFSEPCFFIQLLESDSDYRLGDRGARLYSFDIRFHNSSAGYDDLNSLGDELFGLLEYIELNTGELVRARDMSFEIQDNVLHFFVKYYVETEKKKEPSKKMEVLSSEVGVDFGG